MAKNYLQDFLQRVTVDWKEWSTYQKLAWIERFKQRRARRDVLRDQRMIDSAIERAKVKNARDNRTYYIMRNSGGGINEVNSKEIAMLVRLKALPRMNYMQRLEASIAVVTSNRMTQLNYDRLKSNKSKNKEAAK